MKRRGVSDRDDESFRATGGDDRRGPALLLLGAILLAAWAAVAWQTGGGGVDVPWGRVSSRDPARPLVASALCVVVLVWWAGVRGLASAAERASTMLESMAPAGAALAAVVAGWLGIVYGAHVAGGSDPYGYVSQADLWLRGTLILDFSSLEPLPWRRPEWTLSPLGYRPGPTPYTIVPTYPPGLPILMALAQAAFGAGAKYLVVPLCAAGAVWLTYLLGAQLYDRFAGLVAAALLASSPAFLYQTMWPMSDVPATAFWALALVCAGAARRFTPLASGLGAAAAVLIRPNLVALAIVPALPIMGRAFPGGLRARVAAVAAYAAGVLPGVLTIAALNTYWYGSPGRSGYGAAESLYALDHFWPNAHRYAAWVIETQSAVVILALLPLMAARHDAAVRRPLVRGAAALFIVLLMATYLFYLVFDEWWYLRFFLPAFPLMLVLTSGGLRDVLHRLHPSAAPAAVLVAAPLIAWMAQEASTRASFDLRQQEEAYITIARDVAAQIPADGVVFAMQHSGSLRYYGNRLTLRYDLLPSDALDLAVETLEGRGRRVYLLVEAWEEPAFIGRYSGQSCRGRLGWGASRKWDGIRTARLYDLSPPGCRSRESTTSVKGRAE